MKTKVENLLWMYLSEVVDLSAALLLSADVMIPDFVNVESAFKVNPEPFQGSENFAIREVVEEIHSVQRKPHAHSIKKFALSSLITRHGESDQVTAVVNYIEFRIEQRVYMLLAFPEKNKRDDNDLKSLQNAIPVLAEYFNLRRTREELANRVSVTELFVREVGHDLATAVQAVVAKLRIICDASVDVAIMRKKASEALIEVMNAYSTADSLGLAVDSNYSARGEFWFGLKECILDACIQLEAEAVERDLVVKADINSSIELLGDRPAILLMMKHMLMNAIKYSIASRSVFVDLRKDEDQIVLDISNAALIKLPRGEDRQKIYDFGFRSDAARVEHVNGSGVGLFTARKIVLAHGGLIWCGESQGITRFHIAFPKTRIRGTTFKKKRNR